MLRSACTFLAAILLPSLVLAWLAVRSARDQQVLIEHQQAIISQDVADSLAKNVRTQIDALRTEFVQITQDLLNKSTNVRVAATDFDLTLRDQWAPANVGFSVDLRGTIYSPIRSGGPAARTFLEENERFLSNRENVEAYSSLNSQELVAKTTSVTRATAVPDATTTVATDESPAPDKMFTKKSSSDTVLGGVASTPAAQAVNVEKVPTNPTSIHSSSSSRSQSTAMSGGSSAMTETMDSLEKNSNTLAASGSAISSVSDQSTSSATISPPPPVTSAPSISAPISSSSADSSSYPALAKMAQKVSQITRQVSPQNNFNAKEATLSNTIPEESDFRKLIGQDTSGAIARFLDNKLQLLVWFRPSVTNDLVFGAQLNQARLLERLRGILQSPELKQRDNSLLPSRNAGYCLALLDDTGHPVALSIPGFNTDWKHPFVSTEIGETLPHWEAALYLTDPQQFSKSAQTLRLTVGLIVLLLVVAIVAGGSLIAADIRRQVRVAQQKTDFVSNVSHELKTPLTSIRMFADLLAEGRVTEPERQLTYLKIISAESARLTRLINNVLDFARQERGLSSGERRACDLVEITRDVVETCRPHLEACGQNLSCEIEAANLPILGDRDALSQIVLNLISNAEKYGGGEILVRIRRQETAAGSLGCVDVLDLGPGIPPKLVESIFLPFHRLHDSLSSGIPGSGLGLTLSRRMARSHNGDITYTPRAGGGSCFTLVMPLTAQIS